jgi:hypothetical protein
LVMQRKESSTYYVSYMAFITCTLEFHLSEHIKSKIPII